MQFVTAPTQMGTTVGTIASLPLPPPGGLSTQMRRKPTMLPLSGRSPEGVEKESAQCWRDTFVDAAMNWAGPPFVPISVHNFRNAGQSNGPPSDVASCNQFAACFQSKIEAI